MSSGIHNLRDVFKRISLINISIRTKLLLIYLLCVLIPTIVFSYAFYSSTVKSAKNEKLIIYRQALDRIALSVESNAVSAIEISNIIYPNDAMYDFINNEYTNFRECWMITSGTWIAHGTICFRTTPISSFYGIHR